MTHRWLIGTGGVLALAAALALIGAGGGASLAEDGIIYVDADATPGGDGSTWETALSDLRVALLIAGEQDEIWVAEGTYRPTSDTDRTISFQMKNGVEVYGGFVGVETERGQRDWAAHPTILSGDIGTPDDASDNSYHVFYHPAGTDLDATAILDGFTISGGNAEGTWPQSAGGGMYNDASSPTLTNCTFSGNSAEIDGGGMYNCQDSAPMLTNCTFTGNSAKIDGGGGIYNQGSSPTLINCTFTGNSADIQGGGMYNFLSSPELTNCTFTGNLAENDRGGGMANSSYSSPTLTNVTFSGNSAALGGGMANSSYSSPTLTNCTFVGNLANVDGAGMYNNFFSSPELTNCTFSDNSASNYGGGMENWTYSSPVLLNVTFINNSAVGSGGGIYNNDYSSPVLTNCTFSGNGTSGGGGGISSQGNSSPTLTNVTFSGNTASGGGGMSIDSSSSSALTNCILWGNTPDQIIDTGGASVVNYSDIEGGYTGGTGNIDSDPQFVDAIGGDLRLELDSPAIDAGNNDATGLAGISTDLGCHPRFSDVLSVDDTGNGDPPIVDMGAYEAPPERIFVDLEATGANNGQSWQDALTDLGDALAWAMEGVEIWVAEGTYKPSVAHGGTGERYKSFQMMNGVSIYGGFAGTETERGQRDWANHETILSGDIGIEGDPDDNVYHVFYHPAGTDLDATAILDGFTISGGNASEDGYPHNMGGGMFNELSSPALSNCKFEGNSASGSGGGIHNTSASSPTLTDCTFQGNSAGTEGGGMHNEGSSPTLTGCTFSGNTADAGAGIYNTGSSPTLTDVDFSGNISDNGGGMHNLNSSPVLADCTFAGNTVNGSGGGMFNNGSAPVLVNCIFEGNSAVGNGGGMRNKLGSAPTLTNCTFHGNTATNGGAIHNIDSSAPTLANCILWGDSKPEIDNLDSSTAYVTYSDVDGGNVYAGEGNIYADPLFVDAANGDLHLRPGSPCIDTGNDLAPNLPEYDFEGDPRIMDGDRDGTATVDMGVDEAFWIPLYLPVVLRGY